MPSKALVVLAALALLGLRIPGGVAPPATLTTKLRKGTVARVVEVVEFEVRASSPRPAIFRRRCGSPARRSTTSSGARRDRASISPT
jgi:hypothetical protein